MAELITKINAIETLLNVAEKHCNTKFKHDHTEVLYKHTIYHYSSQYYTLKITKEDKSIDDNRSIFTKILDHINNRKFDSKSVEIFRSVIEGPDPKVLAELLK